MQTAKPIACITYNTNEFLDMKLQELYKQHIISFYAYINHKGEEEVDIMTGEMKRDKDHTHLFIEPNKRIDTMDLITQFYEIDPNNILPLKPLQFQSSKWDDWYLYNLHDEDYLASKFMTREFSYTNDDFHVSDNDDFQQKTFETLHTSKYCTHRNFMNYLNSGGSISRLAYNGKITPREAFAYKTFDDLYERGKRNG